MLITASLPKLPNKPAFTQNRQIIQNHYNDSYYKDTVHFSGKSEITDKTEHEKKYSVILPKKEVKQLFDETDKKNRAAKNNREKGEILIDTVKKIWWDIYAPFINKKMPKHLPPKEDDLLNKHIHRTKSCLTADIWKYRPDKPEKFPPDFDDIMSEKFAVILAAIDKDQQGFKLPDESKPLRKAQEDST